MSLVHFFQRSKEIWGLRKEAEAGGVFNPGLALVKASSIRIRALCQAPEPKGLSLVLRIWEACPANGSLVTRA